MGASRFFPFHSVIGQHPRIYHNSKTKHYASRVQIAYVDDMKRHFEPG